MKKHNFVSLDINIGGFVLLDLDIKLGAAIDIPEFFMDAIQKTIGEKYNGSVTTEYFSEIYDSIFKKENDYYNYFYLGDYLITLFYFE